MSTIRVLHVDDESDIREVVDISLGLDSEFEIRACASGAEALTLAAEWTPSVILLDAEMPLMDGPATFVNLRKNANTADIPVVFMTARTLAGDIKRFMSLGAQGVITKPFDPMGLSALVRSHLGARLSPDVVKH